MQMGQKPSDYTSFPQESDSLLHLSKKSCIITPCFTPLLLSSWHIISFIVWTLSLLESQHPFGGEETNAEKNPKRTTEETAAVWFYPDSSSICRNPLGNDWIGLNQTEQFKEDGLAIHDKPRMQHMLQGKTKFAWLCTEKATSSSWKYSERTFAVLQDKLHLSLSYVAVSQCLNCSHCSPGHCHMGSWVLFSLCWLYRDYSKERERHSEGLLLDLMIKNYFSS